MGACCSIEDKADASPLGCAPSIEKQNDIPWFKLGLFILLSGLTMTVTLAVNIEPPKGHVRTAVHATLAAVTAFSFYLLGGPLLKKLSFKKVTLEHLFIISIIGTYCASLYSTFTGIGHIYYEVVLILLTIYYFGQLTLRRFIRKAESHADMVPGLTGLARRITEAGAHEIDVSMVRTGDLLEVAPKEVIPSDGYIIEGSAYIEQLAHTGEPFPQSMGYGDKVLAGSLVLDGTIRLKSLCDGESREINRLFSSLIRTSPSEVSCHSQKILKYFVPAILVIFVTTFIYWSVFGTVSQAIFNALSVCIVACPCALGLGIPLATKKALLKLKLLGISVKRHDYMSKLSEVDTIVYDKTGTLTSSEIEMEPLHYERECPEEFEGWLAYIQGVSSHPVAKPFWKLSVPIKPDALSITEKPGTGIRAAFSHQGRQHVIEIGNHKISPKAPLSERGRRLFLFLDGEHVATAHLIESIEQKTAIHLREISALVSKQILLTGDTHCPSLFKENLDECLTGLSAFQKREKVKELNSQGRKVLFIGDGQNDVEAMKESYLSLSISEGMRIAQSVADGEMKEGSLTPLKLALEFAKEHARNVKKLYAFTISYNIIGIIIAALGLLHPVIAAILMLVASFTVLFWTGGKTEAIGVRHQR